MYWIVVALAGGTLIVGVTILGVVLAVLRSTRRAKRAGDERLEILREQQQRLHTGPARRASHVGGGVGVAALDDGQ
jgi:hypothetical protein